MTGKRMFIRTTTGVLCILAGTLFAQTGGSGPGSGTGNGGTAILRQVALFIPNESAPPGGLVQMKFMVTEPTPISTGRPILNFDTTVFDNVWGIEVFNPTGDVNGVAVVNRQHVALQYVMAGRA